MLSPIKQQKGAALVGVMMVLLVLTILGSNAFLTSTTELKISANYNQNLQALYAAEAGIQHLLSGYRQNFEYFLQKKTGPGNELSRQVNRIIPIIRGSNSGFKNCDMILKNSRPMLK